MKHSRIALATLALALGASTFLAAQYPPPQDRPDQGRGGWDAPPQDFREVQRQGFHDGIEAARKDIRFGRSGNAEMHQEFRHPAVDRELRNEYRDGFRRGYGVAIAHSQGATGGGAPMMPPGAPMMQPGAPPDHDRGPWDAPPAEFRDTQRRGFHDGIEAARRDIAEQRPPNAERKREFRTPPVPPESRQEYREGFHRGYDMAFAHSREDHEHHGDDPNRR